MLDTHIREFRAKYGKSRAEHMWVVRGGKVIRHCSGSKCSTGFGDEVRDADVIHNHPNNNPALSESDLIMTIYGRANSVTAVTPTHGYWTLKRPANGWPDITHNQIEAEYEKAKKRAAKSEVVQKLVVAIKAGSISWEKGDAMFAVFYVTDALNHLGLHVAAGK